METPNTSWRLKIPESLQIHFYDLRLGKVTVDLGQSMPDFVVRRKDGLPSYQIASLCDDIAFNVNVIVRGEDLLNSTAAQLYLAQLSCSSSFEEVRFVHHALLKDSNGDKMSKSKDSYSIHEQVQRGGNPSEVWQLLSSTIGNVPLSLSAQDFSQNFRL